MSYLGSLLASYGAGQEQKASQPAPATVSSGSSTVTAVVKRDTPGNAAGTKRKADEMNQSAATKPSIAQPDADSKADRSDVRPSQQDISKASAQAKESERSAMKPAKDTSALGVAEKQKQRPAPAPAPVAGPPPKGSFADIMARAKALQATKLGQGPTLKHKAVSQEDPREKRRRETSKGASSARPSSRSGSEAPKRQKPTARGVKSAQKVVPPKPKREPIQISYKGTMRPTQGQPSHRSTAARTSSQRPSNSRQGAVEYDDEEEQDSGMEYYSDASSDMEAGAMDIDEEEELTLRKARAEDAAAKREEDEHRRQKLLQKRAAESASARRRF